MSAERRAQLLVGVAIVAALALAGIYLAAGGSSYAPENTQDPCKHRPWRNPEGLQQIAEQFSLSALDGVGPDDLTIDALVKRAHDPSVNEVILALNATVDGQSTAHYITDLLHDANVKVTRLAHGVPVGGELDYLDEGTLAAAIRSRTPF